MRIVLQGESKSEIVPERAAVKIGANLESKGVYSGKWATQAQGDSGSQKLHNLGNEQRISEIHFNLK